jgi:hypothetical protein
MPTPKDVSRQVKRAAQLRTIKLGDVRVSPTGQRELNTARVNKIVESLDMDLIGTIEVSHRDGFYWVIDGQHRFNALKEFFGEGFEDWEITAWCYFDKTEEQEAELFLRFNDNLAVDAFAKFKVGVSAGRAAESDVDRIVRSLGLKVARSQDNGAISAVSALMKTYTRYGPAGLVQTLWTIRESFGDRGFESVIIDGVGLFRARYEGRIDADKLVSKLSRTLGGVKGVLNRANLIREKTGQTVPQCVAAAITDIYNSGARGVASLGSWWKDGLAA